MIALQGGAIVSDKSIFAFDGGRHADHKSQLRDFYAHIYVNIYTLTYSVKVGCRSKCVAFCFKGKFNHGKYNLRKDLKKKRRKTMFIVLTIQFQ